MKSIIAELDRIAQYIESFEEPWSMHVMWRLDNVTAKLSEINGQHTKLSSVSKNVLNQYLDKMLFLSSNEENLKKIISEFKDKKANEIYKELKNNFGKLSKKEAIEYINSILKQRNIKI